MYDGFDGSDHWKWPLNGKFHSSWGHMVPRSFSSLSRVKGPPERHIEQLWDEIKRLKERIEMLEKGIFKNVER